MEHTYETTCFNVFHAPSVGVAMKVLRWRIAYCAATRSGWRYRSTPTAERKRPALSSPNGASEGSTVLGMGDRFGLRGSPPISSASFPKWRWCGSMSKRPSTMKWRRFKNTSSSPSQVSH